MNLNKIDPAIRQPTNFTPLTKTIWVKYCAFTITLAFQCEGKPPTWYHLQSEEVSMAQQRDGRGPASRKLQSPKVMVTQPCFSDCPPAKKHQKIMFKSTQKKWDIHKPTSKLAFLTPAPLKVHHCNCSVQWPTLFLWTEGIQQN